jgi:hypothetical protein
MIYGVEICHLPFEFVYSRFCCPDLNFFYDVKFIFFYGFWVLSYTQKDFLYFIIVKSSSDAFVWFLIV